jgi:hypothetical protein
MTHDPGLARKLGLAPGQAICLLGASEAGARAVRRACPSGAAVTEKLGRGLFDVILFWPRRRRDLGPSFARLQRRIRPDGAIWAVIPKKAAPESRALDFGWDELQAAGLTTDLVDNKIASITDREYGTRFVIRKDRRGG